MSQGKDCSGQLAMLQTAKKLAAASIVLTIFVCNSGGVAASFVVPDAVSSSMPEGEVIIALHRRALPGHDPRFPCELTSENNSRSADVDLQRAAWAIALAAIVVPVRDACGGTHEVD